MASPKLAKVGNHCVACGTCVTFCPRHALSVYKGLRVVVDEALCVGCGKCADICPAGIIEILQREGGAIEKPVV